jgi:hypothetical protein
MDDLAGSDKREISDVLRVRYIIIIANTMHTRQYSYNGGGACRNFSGSSSALVFDTIKMRGNDTTPRPRHKRDEKAVLITVFQRIR